MSLILFEKPSITQEEAYKTGYCKHCTMYKEYKEKKTNKKKYSFMCVYFRNKNESHMCELSKAVLDQMAHENKLKKNSKKNQLSIK